VIWLSLVLVLSCSSSFDYHSVCAFKEDSHAFYHQIPDTLSLGFQLSILTKPRSLLLDIQNSICSLDTKSNSLGFLTNVTIRLYKRAGSVFWRSRAVFRITHRVVFICFSDLPLFLNYFPNGT